MFIDQLLKCSPYPDTAIIQSSSVLDAIIILIIYHSKDTENGSLAGKQTGKR